jgi:membrane-associated phospholipid phosphatase
MPLRGGFFHRTVVEAIDGLGGPHGAFPSLHVGASFLAAWFDLRHHNALRGLIYVLPVALIAAATIVLRYHWVVDLFAGILLALLAHRLAPRLLARWSRAAGAQTP